MQRKFNISIVGPGRLGSALALALREAGLRIGAIVYRGEAAKARKLAKQVGAEAMAWEGAEFASELTWICVSDAEIAGVALSLSGRGRWKGRTVFHSSGAETSRLLAPLKRKGARVASVHPMMSFVSSSRAGLRGVTFALEGDRQAIATARRIVKALGGEAIAIGAEQKPLYHALGGFASPLVIAELAQAEKIGEALGLKPEQTRRVIGPILRQTLENYLKHGPAAAFSGPVIRGDVETVKKNLAALARVKGAAEVYRALVQAAVENLPGKNKTEIKGVVWGSQRGSKRGTSA